MSLFLACSLSTFFGVEEAVFLPAISGQDFSFLVMHDRSPGEACLPSTGFSSMRWRKAVFRAFAFAGASSLVTPETAFKRALVSPSSEEDEFHIKRENSPHYCGDGAVFLRLFAFSFVMGRKRFLSSFRKGFSPSNGFLHS